MPLLWCGYEHEIPKILRKIHEELCGNHAGGQSLANKDLWQGSYWPQMGEDTQDFARKCDKCQQFMPCLRNPLVEITQMNSPWPFAVWGTDIIRELPIGWGGMKYVVIAVDYFTKWVEAEALSIITTKKIKSFMLRLIICRYVVPYKLISDNGLQFESDKFQGFCDQYGIYKSFSTVMHPQGKIQV